jgi:hypothetical protein
MASRELLPRDIPLAHCFQDYRVTEEQGALFERRTGILSGSVDDRR